MKKLLIAALALAMAAGCVNSKFVYKPGGAEPGASKLPVKIAVLPFADGTENFTVIGSVSWMTEIRKFNLAKVGEPEKIDALVPEFWAKAFANELAASGRFETVRFIYDRSEATDEAFLVEGTLQKAYFESGSLMNPSEFAIRLRAVRRMDNRPVWEKDVARTGKRSPGDYDTCGLFSVQCLVDVDHAGVNRAMQGMFAEAGADLVRTLAPLARGGAGEDERPPAATPVSPAPESVDSTIEGILKGE